MAKKNCEGYKDHMMYSPTGKSIMTSSCKEHLDLSAKGWSHTKPKKKMGESLGPNNIL